MDLSHTFTVPTGVEETWSHFQDIASLAQCFPGATVTEADEESFAGTVKVKLGPIAMLYKGQGVFTERDHDAHAFKVDASGKDKRGNGTAGAKVTLTMVEGAGGSTQVQVVTDLNVTGKPAQFGRGVMQDVSDKLLAQFVSCLEQRLSDPDVRRPRPRPRRSTWEQPSCRSCSRATGSRWPVWSPRWSSSGGCWVVADTSPLESGTWTSTSTCWCWPRAWL